MQKSCVSHCKQSEKTLSYDPFLAPFLAENGTARRYGLKIRFLRGLHRNLDNQLRLYRDAYLADNIPRSVRGAFMSEVFPIDVVKEEWHRTKDSLSEE